MSRNIKKVAILGSGVMGSRIACHFANIGVEVLLLDIVPFELNEKELAKGLTKKDNVVRNRIVNDSLQFALKSKPSPIYNKQFASRIETGNFDDDLEKIKVCDWIIEVVIENIDIKKQLFDKVEEYRKPGSLISSNTSGIPIHLMLDGRSEDFQKHFAGTHFFNPPRYLKLLEVIPTPKTDPEVLDFYKTYGDLYLGKTVVECKDTPTFIANRVGIYSIASIFSIMEELDLSVGEIDALTGPAMARAKSATFRTCDVVGLDTLVKVADALYATLKDDECVELFNVPKYCKEMVEKNWLGDKTKQGFYKKTKDENGKRLILELDPKTLEYGPKTKAKFATLKAVKQIDNQIGQLKAYYKGTDKAGDFFRKFHFGLFAYASNRIPEISDDIYKIDDAMRSGFGWGVGPFETWDILGVEKVITGMEEAGIKPAQWVYDMVASGCTSFYQVGDGKSNFYKIENKAYIPIPGTDDFIKLDNYRTDKVVWKNSGSTLFDIGDDVLCLEFNSKMNTLGGEVLEGINTAIDKAEKEQWRGLVIGNDGENFSVGANLGMVFMMVAEEEWDEVNFAISYFQNTMMRVRYSSIPVVVAPHGMALGGGCEISLHADKIQAAAETYMGLVEVGVGVIPGGGGTKEMVLRASDAYYAGDPQIPYLSNSFLSLATAKVSTSAHEAIGIGFLNSKDSITINKRRLIADAKASVIEMSNAGYTQPLQRDDIQVLGKQVIAAFYTGANAFYRGNYMSEHDKLITEKLAYVMAGGDLSMPTKVNEQYLLDLEREAFLSLLGTRKTQERIQSILTSGKPLRN